MNNYAVFFRNILLLVLLATGVGAGADSIVVQGESHDQVYVRESAANYYVQFPETGKVVSYPKDQVASGAVTVSEDPAERAALLAQWKLQAHGPVPESRKALASPQPAAIALERNSIVVDRAPVARRQSFGGGDLAENDPNHVIQNFRLSGVPLGVALKAALRSVGLDYVVYDDLIFVSDPENLRRESLDTMGGRSYTLENVGSETLPKIVVQNVGSGSANNGGGGNGSGGAGSTRNLSGSFGSGR